jgi:hypothetical protein
MLRLPGIALTCVLVSSLRSHPLALLLLLLLPLLLLLWPPPAPHGPTQRTGCGQEKVRQPAFSLPPVLLTCP